MSDETAEFPENTRQAPSPCSGPPEQRRSASTKPLELARNGHSTYSIAISRDASLSEKRGSEELQHFIEEISGAHLPIVTDEQKVHGNLVLVGKSDYLDSLGCKFPLHRSARRASCSRRPVAIW